MESLLGNPDITVEDCLRLGLLFALRYEGLAKPEMDQIHRLLISRGLGDLDVKVSAGYGGTRGLNIGGKGVDGGGALLLIGLNVMLICVHQFKILMTETYTEADSLWNFCSPPSPFQVFKKKIL